ncbi:MAG: hypothetical protein KF696_06525 [Planctomycetes bacterium]|nr:hypothetical protein [Planctomycetota bacterium]MCW8137220.1 hypothetical protein [Planctomycetota bacterium]
MSGAATEDPPTVAPTQAKPREWDGKTRTGLGILIFFYTFRLLGPRFAYALLYPVVLYYQFFARANGRGSYDYLRRRFPGIGRFKLWFMRYRHFMGFGRCLIDRGYAFLGMMGKVRLNRDGQEAMQAALDKGCGVILLSAHLGNWELAAYCLGDFHHNGRKVPVNAVMFKGDGERVERQLRKAGGEPPFKVIASNDSLQASIECKNALERGEIVAIHGDRLLGERGIEVDFLGAPAKFPTGPFVLAASTGAPVVFTFANRVGYKHYALLARGPYYFEYTSRREREANLKQWVGMYASQLEVLLQKYPLQWHNFYMFWGTKRGTGW